MRLRTPEQELQRWIKGAEEAGATYMLVVCDTFDYDEYPTHVYPGDSLHEVQKKYKDSVEEIIAITDVELGETLFKV